MPIQGMPQYKDYHTIKIEACYRHQYLEDYGKKITEILSPFDDFESCFIHNDSQIICFGPKGFTSFDIDFNETKVKVIKIYVFF